MANQIGLERFLHEGKDSYVVKPENIDTYWDNDYDMMDPSGWEARYIHEANIILTVCKENAPVNNILEIGSGDGYVIEKLATQYPNCDFLGLEVEGSFYENKSKRVSSYFGKL